MTDRAYVLSLTFADVIAILDGERDVSHANTLQLLNLAVDAVVAILRRDDERFVRPRRHVVEVER